MTTNVVSLTPNTTSVFFKHRLHEAYLHLNVAPALAESSFAGCVNLLEENKSLRTPTNVNSLLDLARNAGTQRTDFLTVLEGFMNAHGNSISGSVCVQNRETGVLENVSAASVIRHIIAVALGQAQHEDAPSAARREQQLALAPLPRTRSLVPA